jgi:hypothetical protein
MKLLTLTTSLDRMRKLQRIGSSLEKAHKLRMSAFKAFNASLLAYEQEVIAPKGAAKNKKSGN